MRLSIRTIGILVASLCGLTAYGLSEMAGAQPPARAKKSAPQKDAEAFLATMTGLLAPVSTAAAGADWRAATDVTPEHTGERAGADKALAALSGAVEVINRAKALLKEEKQLDDITVRQLRQLLLGAAESPGTIPEVVTKRVELEARQSGILDG